LFYGARYHASEFTTQPDFAKLAAGFGIASVALGQSTDPETALTEALHRTGPMVIDVPIHPLENVLPMVPPGGANRSMIDREVAHA
jgi:acetolactate synthase-1/2/3 large subunit